MKNPGLHCLAAHLRALRDADHPDLPADLAAELPQVPDLLDGFVTNDTPDPAPSGALKAHGGPADDLPDPEALLAVLAPRRAYGAPSGLNWAAERQATPAHRTAHALGHVTAHLIHHAHRLLGRTLDPHHAAALGHFAVGMAEGLRRD